MEKKLEFIERTIHIIVVSMLTVLFMWQFLFKKEIEMHNEAYIDRTYGYLINSMAGDCEIIKNFDIPQKK